MTSSLRSRLIIGTFAGMAIMLLLAGTAIYTLQARHLYRTFDQTLLSSANSLSLLIHPGPFGYWFDEDELHRLPAGTIREGAIYQIWSDWPIVEGLPMRPPRRSPDEDGRSGPPPRPAGEDAHDFGPPQHRWEDRPPPDPRTTTSPNSLSEQLDLPPDQEQGTRIIRSDPLGKADLPQIHGSGNEPVFRMIDLPDGRRGRALGIDFTVPLRPQEHRHVRPAQITAVVAANVEELQGQTRSLFMLLIITAIGTMAVAGGVAWLVVSRGLRPLDEVAGQIAAMDETALKQRLTAIGAPLEIKPLVQQLNGLLGRLDEAFERERSLTADVAHELRTPIAEIRTIAEITLKRLRDPGEYNQALSDTLDVAKSLQSLIEKLLTLARLEAGQAPPQLSTIFLSNVIMRHWEQISGKADSRGITLDNRCPDNFMALADPDLLDIAVGNVITNAVMYTPDDHAVTVEAAIEQDRCCLRIINPCRNLSRQQALHVFDRLWRADPARGDTGQNCGLGLTLVRRAMESMGGKAEADVDDRNCFILTLIFRVDSGTS